MTTDSAMSKSALAWDENGADAVGVLDDGDARLGDDGLDQAVAAARDDEIDELVLAAEEGNEGAVGIVDQLDGALGQCFAVAERGDEGAVGVDGFLAAAQDGGVAGLEAEDSGVDGDVGAGLVDDGDDADGDADLGDFDAVGAGPGGHLLAERLRERADLAHAFDHGGEGFLGDAETVDERGVEAGLLGGGDVLGVRGEDCFLVLLELGGDLVEHVVEARGGQSREGLRGLAGRDAEVADLLLGGGQGCHGAREDNPTLVWVRFHFSQMVLRTAVGERFRGEARRGGGGRGRCSVMGWYELVCGYEFVWRAREVK